MSQADELLNSISTSQKSARTVDPDTEEHIIISNDRFITVPDSLKKIAVQYDHNMETVTFDCPRYWDGLDMSPMKIYINYMRPDRVLGMYLADNIRVDDTDNRMMHFTWTITNNVTFANGKLRFLVCIKKTNLEGIDENHWNSEINDDMYISEGLNVEDPITEEYADIITQLLTRMDATEKNVRDWIDTTNQDLDTWKTRIETDWESRMSQVEANTSPEAMQDHVDGYLNGNPDIVQEHIDNYLEKAEPTSPEAMEGYVGRYLDEHPPLLVIGPDKPGVRCVWFNTSKPFGEDEPSGTDENIAVSLTGTKNESAYLDVETEKQPVYDFTII